MTKERNIKTKNTFSILKEDDTEPRHRKKKNYLKLSKQIRMKKYMKEREKGE